MGRHGTGKVLKICKFCKKEFLARHDRKGIYCSRSCAGRLKKQIILKIKKICIVCNKEYIIKLYRKEISFYCSSDCRQKNMPKKENHHNWKGGFSRTWSSRNLIKKMIQEKGKCEICSSVINLQGHHIVPYSKDSALREVRGNIQVLCRNCHAIKHPEMSNFILKGYIHA